MLIGKLIHQIAFRTLFASFILLGLSHPVAEAQPKESSYQVPRLVNASVTQRTPNAPSTYLFTLEIPPEATHSIKALVITQRSGLENISFVSTDTRAVLGDKLAQGTPLSLVSIGGEEETETNQVIVVFDEPVEPGNKVTVAVKVRHNPSYGGNYQFGVTAFTDSDHSFPLYLGTVRLHFFGYN
ncbi:MAG: DUF2808 domain-containing protein [Microcystaceae cyanobacterium]